MAGDRSSGGHGPPGAIRVGTISGVDVFVRRSWLLVAGLIAVLLAPRIEVVAPGLGGLVYVAGLAFAVLLYLSVLLHEVSHALMAKAFGMGVRSVTLHFLGGVTEIDGEAETPRREFWISVVGPLTSAAVGGAAYAAAQVAPGALLRFALESLAAANLVVAVLNMLPGLPLDGGKVLRSLVWAVTGRPTLATQVAGWAGRVVAVAAFGYPLVISAVLDVPPTAVDFLLAAVVAMFLWTGASQSLATARLRERLPALTARGLARRALAVPADLPLGEAVRRAREAEAGSLVVLGADLRPVGVVNEDAVAATPEARRPWMNTEAVAKSIAPGTTLSADLGGEPLIRAMNAHPSSEYLLVEPDGSVFGVLVTSDVDAAFAGA